MDGDAFHKNDQVVVSKPGQHCFVLGLHAFSDASQVSCSGGKHVLQAALYRFYIYASPTVPSILRVAATDMAHAYTFLH